MTTSGDARVKRPGDEEEEGRRRLTVQVFGNAGEPERLLLVYRDGPAGRVRVREWSSAHPEVPREYEIAGSELYQALGDAVRRGRRVSQELYRVRRWLDGADV